VAQWMVHNRCGPTLSNNNDYVMDESAEEVERSRTLQDEDITQDEVSKGGRSPNWVDRRPVVKRRMVTSLRALP